MDALAEAMRVCSPNDGMVVLGWTCLDTLKFGLMGSAQDEDSNLCHPSNLGFAEIRLS